MATSVLVYKYDSNGTGITFAGSTATELGDSLYVYSDMAMEDLVFKSKDTWTECDTDELDFSKGAAVGSLAGKPVNFTGYDGGSTYSFGTIDKSEIYYKEGTAWALFGSASYPSLATNPDITAMTSKGYVIKGIIFL